MNPLYKLFCHIFESLTRKNDNKRLAKQEEDISDLEIIKDISYVSDGNNYHKLDIIRRKDFQDDKLIVDIHGGGLMYGTKEVNRHSNYRFARKGYVVVSISYRLIPDVKLIDQIKDCFDALDFLRNHKEEYSLPFDNLFLVGDSAGGLLSYVLVSLNTNDELMKIFNFSYERFNFLSLCTISCMSIIKRKDNLAFINKVAFDKKDKEFKYFNYLLNTTSLIHSNMVPWIMSTSDKDMIRNDSYSLKNVISKSNIELEFYDFSSKKNKLSHVFVITYPDYEESKDFYSKVDIFFRKHMSY